LKHNHFRFSIQEKGKTRDIGWPKLKTTQTELQRRTVARRGEAPQNETSKLTEKGEKRGPNKGGPDKNSPTPPTPGTGNRGVCRGVNPRFEKDSQRFLVKKGRWKQVYWTGLEGQSEWNVHKQKTKKGCFVSTIKNLKARTNGCREFRSRFVTAMGTASPKFF